MPKVATVESSRAQRPESLELIADVAVEPSVRGAVQALREILGVEVAYATRHTASNQILETFEGPGESFGVAEGVAIPLEATYCRRILLGELPSIISDVRAHPLAGAMPMTAAADVGAFASVPLLLSDGTLYGTLCCGSHHAQPSWRENDVRLMRVVARIVADQLERDVVLRELSRAGEEAAALDALLAALAAVDGGSRERGLAVAKRALAVARELDLDEPEVVDAEHVGLLHELGALAGAGPSGAGEEIVAASVPLAHLAPALRALHEHWDGSGAPDGLAGSEIPAASRIALACASYEMLLRRSEDVRAGLRSESGRRLDPRVVEVLLAGLG